MLGDPQMELMKTKLTLYILPNRRRNCFIFYGLLLIFLVTGLVHQIYTTARTWTPDDWVKLKPPNGIIMHQNDYLNFESDQSTPQSSVTCDPSTRLLIIIFSRPEAFETRKTIRQTWLSPVLAMPSERAVVHKFLFGQINSPSILNDLRKEFDRYGDLIIDQSFTDSYKLLVLKTISMVSWVNRYCPSVEAVLKTDDDSWINVYNLLQELPSLPPGIHGHVYRYPGSSSDPNDVWYMSHEAYPFKHYPDFTSGSGYLLVNRDTHLFQKILGTMVTIITIWVEDVFLTGLVAEKAGIPRYHHPYFNPIKVPLENVCQYRTLFSSHKLTKDDFESIYSSLTNPNLNCPES